MAEIIGKAPPHYTQGKAQAWDVMETCLCRSEESFIDYLRCSIYKYLARAPHKGQERDDVVKIMNFAQRWIDTLDGKPLPDWTKIEKASDDTDYWSCDKCGYDKVDPDAGAYGCPNCHGEGLVGKVWVAPQEKVQEYIRSLNKTGGRP